MPPISAALGLVVLHTVMLIPGPPPDPGASDARALDRTVNTAALSAALWPLQPEPEVVSGFDPPTSTWGSGHRGADLVGTVGEPVRSALAGRVVFAGTIAGRGVVVVDHGEQRTTYEPVMPAVQPDQQVAAGQAIGVLQAGGSHCPPQVCLHWGLIRTTATGDQYADPLSLLGQMAPIRLLPLLP